MDLGDRIHFTVSTTRTRARTIQKMQMIATRPGFDARSSFFQSGDKPVSVVFTVVVAVMFGDADADGSAVSVGKAVSFDVWLFAVV